MNGSPLVSIVTPCLNMHDHLVRCLDNVAAQTYPDIEHLVIDGGSTDGTIELLTATTDVKWISEPDDGQSEAINKGWGLASGQLLTWLNADDLLRSDAVARAVYALKEHPDSGFAYGCCKVVEGNEHYIWDPPHALTRELLEWGIKIPQQGTLIARWAIERCGPLDEDLHLAMDHDLWVRLIDAGIQGVFVPSILGIFEVHDTSKTGTRTRAEFLEEEARSFLNAGWLEGVQVGLGRAAAEASHDGDRVDPARLDREIGERRALARNWGVGDEMLRAAALTQSAILERHARPWAALRYLCSPSVWLHRNTRWRILRRARTKLDRLFSK